MEMTTLLELIGSQGVTIALLLYFIWWTRDLVDNMRKENKEQADNLLEVIKSNTDVISSVNDRLKALEDKEEKWHKDGEK